MLFCCFFEEIYSRPPRKNYVNNKTDVNFFDDFRGLDILDLNDYGPEQIMGDRYVVVVIDNFSKFGRTVPLKNKNVQTLTNSFENILNSSKRSPELIESNDGTEFVTQVFNNLLNINNIKRYSGKTTSGVVLAERFNCSIRDLHRKLAFERGDAKWIDVLPIKKQYHERTHLPTKLTPKEAS